MTAACAAVIWAGSPGKSPTTPDRMARRISADVASRQKAEMGLVSGRWDYPAGSWPGADHVEGGKRWTLDYTVAWHW